MSQQFSKEQRALLASANKEVTCYLEQYAVPESRAPAERWIVDGYDLHTHPDLGEWLEEVGKPTGCFTFYFLGYNVLATQAGVIFALAKSMSTLAFRLPHPTNRRNALLSGATPYLDIGPEWVEFHAWNTEASILQTFCISAYRHTLNL